MSAKNRTKKDGSKTISEPADFYETPAWCVHSLLDCIGSSLITDPDQVLHEPAAGGGAIIHAVNQWLRRHSQETTPYWHAVELRKEAAAKLRKTARSIEVRDFLDVAPDSSTPGGRPKLLITNPPYSMAGGFVEHALKWENASVVMLLRLNFLGSQKRAKLFHESMPDVYVLPKRPSFTNNRTDATEYAWFVWPADRHYGRRAGRIEVLPLPG